MAVNFVFYDVAFLIAFAIFTSYFLYTRRKRLESDGPLLLYKTKWGISLIEFIGKKYKKTLRVLSYASIGTGYVLMGLMIFLIVNTVYLYLTTNISSVIKAPPIAPLIPYFPKLFGLQSLFPPFYFIYFMVAILIVATVHEFSHGIFARRYNIKIKSTGFGFFKYFPAFFGAFVEQDDKQMKKTKKFEQMSILSAGVFANVVIAVLFYLLLLGFFMVAFSPSGVQFDAYPYTVANISAITMINGVSVSMPTYDGIMNLTNETGFNSIKAYGNDYVITKNSLAEQKESNGIMLIYYDSPAVRSSLESVIGKINNRSVNSIDELRDELSRYSPGEKITLTVLGSDGEFYDKDITLGENPENKGSPWIGIGFSNQQRPTSLGKIYSLFYFKEPHVYYEPNFEGGLFWYYLLWWVMIINILVALFNMLPLGILDGGRFFYLTVSGITGSEKAAMRTFKVVSALILTIFVVLMVRWVATFFGL